VVRNEARNGPYMRLDYGSEMQLVIEHQVVHVMRNVEILLPLFIVRALVLGQPCRKATLDDPRF
jgi:hypothetical protein